MNGRVKKNNIYQMPAEKTGEQYPFLIKIVLPLDIGQLIQ